MSASYTTAMLAEDPMLAAARRGDEEAFRELMGPHTGALRACCYRMAGSLDEVDDLLQESLLRAWRGLQGFDGRSSLRTWLYRVCMSACVDALERRPARWLSVDLGPPADPNDPMPAPREEGWIGPCPPPYWEGEPGPEARYSARQSVAFAFLAALQLLPARQRAVLLARDVLGLSAQECAETLGWTLPAVNSALQRAREAIDARAAAWRPNVPKEGAIRSLLRRYVEAWERSDVRALTALLREETTLAMPPFPAWLRGAGDIAVSIGRMVLVPGSAGAFRLVPAEANALPALAAYRREEDGALAFASLHVLGFDGGGIASITAFLEPGLAVSFGLPATLDPQ